MNPRLIVISGKLKGTEFILEKESDIGRDSANGIWLDDNSVSRRHCLIKRENGSGFFIQDLESFNGTFVNGTPVAKQEIKHGDQIGIGDIVMFFLLQETGVETVFHEPQPAIVADNFSSNQSTIRLARADALYLRPEKLLAELPQMERTARDLSVLLKISSVLNTTQDLGKLQKSLSELITEVISAQRGAILLVDNDKQIYSHFLWNPVSKNQKNIQISKTIIEQCLDEQMSILCSDVGENEQYNSVESLALSKVRSVLCVPIILADKTLGVIYLDSSDIKSFFDKDHLQLLTGIAGIAAIPLKNAGRIEELKLENRHLLNRLDEHHKMIGESNKIKDIFNLITRISTTDSTVLLLGESGTGKELAARAIHQSGKRKERPFIVINCATLNDNLLESELFGHEKGSFTGAVSTKKGQFELADGGTVFLDEIGELPFALQAKLLRVLQEREIIRLGGAKPIKIDIRVIAATNRNIEELVRTGVFREDLFYRLNVINIKMPPLRERREDILLLAQFFINKYNRKCNLHIKDISAKAKKYLQNHNWKGNVRELENAIERAVIFASGDLLDVSDLPETITTATIINISGKSGYQESVSKAKQLIVENALAKTGGDIGKAAKFLQIHPNNLYRLMSALDVKVTDQNQ